MAGCLFQPGHSPMPEAPQALLQMHLRRDSLMVRTHVADAYTRTTMNT